MRRITEGILAATLLVFGTHSASATTLTFDDAYAASANPATYYSSEGVTITGTYFGVVGGVGNGDPGNWHLQGTNGSAFLGCNQGDSCSPTFNLLSSVNGMSMDVAASWGETTTFTVSGYFDNTLVDSQTYTLADPDSATGTWQTFVLNGEMNKIVVSSSGADAYGIDNVNLGGVSNTPEPATWSALASGLGLVGLLRFRKRK